MATTGFKCTRLFRHYLTKYCVIRGCKHDTSTSTNPTLQEKKFPEVIFSGIQPTGVLHLGNYFGAVRKWIDLQNDGKTTIYSVVDLHSLTLGAYDPECLRKYTLEMTACLLACGIDPNKSILFLQSMVPEHTQLCWILNALGTIARLDNLTQYKEKSSKLQVVPLALLSYPVLQAADILLYKATHVPVGKDQVQHLQVTRDLAEKFNRTYGAIFPMPQALIGNDTSSNLKSLRVPTKKMSKSEDPRGRIDFLDPIDVIHEKFKKAVTDCTSAVTYDPQERPGVSNLITIHSLFTGKNINEICEEASGINTGQYKLLVADVVIEWIKPVQCRLYEYLRHPEHLHQILTNGSAKCSEMAQATWTEVRNAVGLQTFQPSVKEKIARV